MKDLTTEKDWPFELRVGDGIDIPVYLVVGLMQRDQFTQQHQNIDTLNRPCVVNTQIKVRNEKYPDAGKTSNYAFDKNSVAYGEIVSCVRHSAKDNI